MQDINDILSKHFAGESNPQEEAVVSQWKEDHQEEYEILSMAWSETVDFSYKEYDSKAALNKIEARLQGEETTKGKVFQLNKFVRYAAAACAVLLVGMSAVWFLSGNNFVSVENDGNVAKQVNLPDGSTVWLAANSTLEYHKEFETNRAINLEGEAYFDVAKDPSHPFVISTEFGEVEVLGTAFNVDVNENSTEVFVERGKVAVRNDHDQVELTAGQESVVSESKVTAAQLSDDANVLSWKTGNFIFDETPLAEVVEELNGYYSDYISLENKSVSDVPFSGEFNQRPVKELIEIIVLTCGVEAEYGEDTIRLK
ncbi:MAG: FecR domain-containing protein [Flavobacteriales bacterium]|nr:FecR domain-containing protein [Flavobacteriales bacterium]